MSPVLLSPKPTWQLPARFHLGADPVTVTSLHHLGGCQLPVSPEPVSLGGCRLNMSPAQVTYRITDTYECHLNMSL